MLEGQRNLEDRSESDDFENLTDSVPFKSESHAWQVVRGSSVTKRQYLGLRFGIVEDLVTLRWICRPARRIPQVSEQQNMQSDRIVSAGRFIRSIVGQLLPIRSLWLGPRFD